MAEPRVCDRCGIGGGHGNHILEGPCIGWAWNASGVHCECPLRPTEDYYPPFTPFDAWLDYKVNN